MTARGPAAEPPDRTGRPAPGSAASADHAAARAADAPPGDKWSDWLLMSRFGAGGTFRDAVMRMLGGIRDEVLRGAAIAPGDTVLDVGCGDGLIAFGAIDAVGPTGQVVFSDISVPLLARCRATAEQHGVADRCRFVQSGLPDLTGIADATADAATTRSVLIYVDDLAASFASLHRVLRPGGRLSVFEPINRFGHPEPAGRLWGFEMPGPELAGIAAKVHAGYQRHTPDATSPLLAFDERDLVAHAEAAGFDDVALRYEAVVQARLGPDDEHVTWEALRSMAPNPLVPALGEIVDDALAPAERATLAAHVTAEIDAGRRTRREARAYLTARKPG